VARALKLNGTELKEKAIADGFPVKPGMGAKKLSPKKPVKKGVSINPFVEEKLRTPKNYW